VRLPQALATTHICICIQDAYLYMYLGVLADLTAGSFFYIPYSIFYILCFYIPYSITSGWFWVAVCCRVLPCVAVCCRVLQCVAVCCSVLQWAAVCCSEPLSLFPIDIKRASFFRVAKTIPIFANIRVGTKEATRSRCRSQRGCPLYICREQ